MYLRHFNFTTHPFAVTPDPAFLYASNQHAAAMTMLEYAIESQAWFCLLTGDIGSGKTTLIRRFVRTLENRITVGLVSNTHRRFRSVHPWALSALGIRPGEMNDIACYDALTGFIIGEYAKGRRTLLIFDEAQNLSIQALEELRLLSNINSEGDFVLQTMLVGQPELRRKMAKPELRQFAQRVAVDAQLTALSLDESMSYVRHRLAIAGRSDEIFHPKAVELIHAHSKGIPRLINQLCDLSLVYAFADGRDRVSALLAAKAVQDRDSGKGNTLRAGSGVADPAEPESAAVPAIVVEPEPELPEPARAEPAPEPGETAHGSGAVAETPAIPLPRVHGLRNYWMPAVVAVLLLVVVIAVAVRYRGELSMMTRGAAVQPPPAALPIPAAPPPAAANAAEAAAPTTAPAVVTSASTGPAIDAETPAPAAPAAVVTIPNPAPVDVEKVSPTPSGVPPIPTLRPVNKAAVAMADNDNCPYPREAMDQGLTGAVFLLVHVASDGRPTTTRIDRSSGSDVLDQAAVRCVTQFGRFPAALDSGAADGYWGRMRFKWSFGS